MPRRRSVLCLWRDERGAIAVIAALLLTALVGMAALVVDLGMLYVVRSELQNGADAGALAGVVELATNGSTEAEAMAIAYATQPTHYHLANPAPGAGAVAVTILGSGDGDGGDDDEHDDDDDGGGANYRLRVKVGPTSVPTIFARVLAIDSADVSAVAVAQLERRIVGSGPGNVLPFGISRDLLVEDHDEHHDEHHDGHHGGDDHHDGHHGHHGTTYQLGESVQIPLDPQSPGNFGILDLDGGSNSNSDTVDWIEHGFDDVFIIPEDPGHVDVEGTPGISGNSLSGAISSRIGDRALFPVFDQVTGHGANTRFRVVDFIGGVILSYQLTGEQGERHITIQIVEFTSPDLIVGGGQTSSNNTISTPVLIQ